jgi:adenine/guanine phosphoribosyltransferase-like PRPP-binding protein
MEQNEALDLYRRTGAYLEGHFRLSSGLHSPGYMQSALVLQHPADAASLGTAIAGHVRQWNPTLVLSPALGGLIIGHEVARGLGVRAMFAERAGGTALTLRRGFAMTSADRVLVVEDVFTTGKSTRETMEVGARGWRPGRRGGGHRRSEWRHDRFRRAFVCAREPRGADVRPGQVSVVREGRAGRKTGVKTDVGSGFQVPVPVLVPHSPFAVGVGFSTPSFSD